MRLFLAILVGKITASISRSFHIGGGSAAPGLYALKIEPDLVKRLARKIPQNVVITGTNGKTTTARLLAHLASEAGLNVIINSTGSNLERGIASALVNKYSLGVNVIHPPGGLASHLGIWELDEAAFNSVTSKLKPNIIVFLNVFRDQLDRYGEVDSVINRWCETISKLDQKTVILVNGDDLNTLKLRKCFKDKIETFGVEDYKIIGESLEKSGHHRLDFEAKNVKTNGLTGSSFELTINHKPLTINLPVPGVYHIYDAVAALAAADHIGLPVPKLLKSLKNFSPAFGRVEKLPFGYIFLIKNPAGATQVFETITPQIKPGDKLLLALNDNLADGTDVSWIWDADFEKLLTHEITQNSLGAKLVHPPGVQIVVSGTRAYDLAVRLKYAGFDSQKIQVEPSLKNALKEAREGLKGQLYILPTYTSMLEIQGILTKEGVKSHYWKEL